ncbi:DUF3618 domain-containing protein [Aurantimonas sp. HBX-1]|uniref:DUF3618 domain-containing protein n=1 Tax=Aurantimonas sp. HBX-1 TaxID=2906072 RepID=UPI001F2758A6|nr:DUF3618 domain-containing protein [Aurantimonas sp. HBX-1]UIJ72767.1 DUF3618 domain-containing protein [Aurantimonas sp. HBX-1]
MSDNTTRLEQEAETHRSKLDSTLDELRGRLSVGQIVDELSGYVREGQGADAMNNFGRQVRDNPLALGLVGAGLAWLFLGDGVRSESHRLTKRYGDWRDDREYDDFEGAFPAGSADAGAMPRGGRPMPAYPQGGTPPVGGAASASSTNVSSGSHGSVGGSIKSGASSASGAVGSAAGSVKSGASNLASSVGDAANRAGGAASDAAGSATDAMRRASHDASDAARHAGSAAWEGARHAGQGAYRTGRRAQRTVIDAMHDEPLVFGALALAIGAAIGAALPATRREDELVGGMRDKVRDDAVAYGRDTLHRAEHVAGAAYEAASEEADAKGLKPDTKSGETLAEKAGSVARAAGEAAKDDAKKQDLT